MPRVFCKGYTGGLFPSQRFVTNITRISVSFKVCNIILKFAAAIENLFAACTNNIPVMNSRLCKNEK